MPIKQNIERYTQSLNKKRSYFFFFVFLFILSIVGVAMIKRGEARGQQIPLTINEREFMVQIAETPRKREVGLSNVDELPLDEGMLFIFPEKDYRTFWMKDTLIPLDIIFIDDQYRIVEIFHNVPPCTDKDCEYYRSIKRAKYVLEINGGLSSEYGFRMSNLVEFEY